MKKKVGQFLSEESSSLQGLMHDTHEQTSSSSQISQERADSEVVLQSIDIDEEGAKKSEVQSLEAVVQKCSTSSEVPISSRHKEKNEGH